MKKLIKVIRNMEKAFLARHQIQNINGRIIAYELLFRGDDGYAQSITSNLLATSKVILNLLTHMDQKKVLGEDVKGFVNIDQEVLFSGIVNLLNPEYFVLEILETTEVDDKLVQLLRKFKKRGFQIALDDFDCSREMYTKFLPILPLLDFVKFDIQLKNKETYKKFLKLFQQDGKKIIAEKIETLEEYKQAKEDNFDYFQGFYFKRPQVLEVEVPAHSQKSTILHLINLIKDDREVDEIDKYAKNQPELVINLLKYLNSPTNNVKEPVVSLKHGINLLGRERLLRWLLLYLYSDIDGDGVSKTLLNTAISRATRMEEEAEFKDKDKAFLIGMLSLLDILFSTPMEIILRGVPLERSIVDAITTRSGDLGKLLESVEGQEKMRLKEIVERNFNNLNTGDVIAMLQKNNIFLSEI